MSDISEMIEGNVLIRASAGTGKTFSLATRFIRLMLFDGVDPERIVALTFSRAAAQEIYTALLKRLWKAADTEEGAAKERENLLARLPESKRKILEARAIDWSSKTFANLLGKVVSTQHTGAIATLDSFILRLVGSFPLEMGFRNAVEVLDSAGEKDAVDMATRMVLSRTDGTEFAEAFRRASKGTFARQCVSILSRIMQQGWRKLILEHPECKSWTAESMAGALELKPFDGFADETETKSYAFLNSVTEKKPRQWIEKFIDHLVKTKAGETPIPSKANIAVEFAEAVARHPLDPYVEHRKKNKFGGIEIERYEYSQELFAAAHEDLRCLADAYLIGQLKVVEAKIKLFAIIEKEYDKATRKSGKLTFQDFTNAAKDDRQIELENLRFRFDSRLDHWALDEFQDTSEVQWACLRPLVESAAGGGGRSVIAVGDLKQSIYTWRGGDDKPFEEMMRWPWFSSDAVTGQEFGRIENSKISYRYGKKIADFINLVFDGRILNEGGFIPEERKAACERWLREDCWLEHIPETDKDGKAKVSDYVKVRSVEKKRDAEADDAILETLFEEIDPVWKAHEESGSTESVGILVRRNTDGLKIAEYLRKKGVSVVWEGMNAILDMPAVQGVINLLRLAEFPGDSFAWNVVSRLFPIREILFPALDSSNLVSNAVAERLSHLGLARTLSEFCGKLCAPSHGLDKLSCERLRALVRLGCDYERRRSARRGVDGFVRFLEVSGKREAASSSKSIRILSIHRSKGLTFDRVFVPLMESDSMVEPTRHSVLFGKDREWVLPHLSSDVAGLNPHTKSVFDEQSDARLLEQLRLYYVALTRARKALYVIFEKKEAPGGVLFQDLVARAVKADVYESGTVPPYVSTTLEPRMERKWDFHAAEPMIERRAPSRMVHAAKGESSHAASAALLFEEAHGAAASKGVKVHAEYQEMEWADDEQLSRMPPSFRQAFARPEGEAVVWRERAYEFFDGARWETGQFDRVVFSGSGEGRSATIYDFKTNSLEIGEDEASFAERMKKIYFSQMNLYRQALSKLTNIALDRISVCLLLESTGQAVFFPSFLV